MICNNFPGDPRRDVAPENEEYNIGSMRMKLWEAEQGLQVATPAICLELPVIDKGCGPHPGDKDCGPVTDPETEEERMTRILGPEKIQAMQDFARAMVKKYPKASPARIARMVAKKFKFKLSR